MEVGRLIFKATVSIHAPILRKFLLTADKKLQEIYDKKDVLGQLYGRISRKRLKPLTRNYHHTTLNILAFFSTLVIRHFVTHPLVSEMTP